MSRPMDKEGTERDWSQWQSVSDLLQKVTNTHSASLELVLKTDGSGYKSFVAVEIRSTVPLLTGPGLPLRLSLQSHYPHQKHASFSSLCLELIRRMDKRIGEEAYRQRELPLDPPVT